MKSILLAVAVLPVLIACQGTMLPRVEPQVISTVEYVVKIPPKELMTLPARPADVNLQAATQKDVAAWMIQNEDYVNTLINNFIGVARFLTEEQGKLTEQAKKENAINMVLPPLKPIIPK